MDFKSAARQEYSGGIIFTSYVIAVLGAMTTLELLTKRTHISGFYNWFLLSAAAASMGGVGIWCMHFIGNNSLTITLANGEVRALYYSPGFTFLSLIVAIITMFLAFVFVGITEEAKVVRIVPSGVIAGLGIVSMHYLGQVAVDFFILKNKTSYVVCAVIIAVCAVTAALFIFFKLREQWANQWYKRLGCAMLMGLAVCGMHYTAMVGTEYYPGRTNGEQPSSVLKTPVIIGVATAIVVSTCVLFFAIGVKHEFLNTLFCKGRRDQYKHIILDVVFFDTNGRILVNIDGLVPMKEIWSEEQDNDGFIRDFTPNHPLFAALLKITIGWIKLDDDANDPVISYSRQKNYSEFEARFLDAANQLVEDLHLSELSDLGYLFDSVIRTNTIVEKHHGLFSKIALEGIQKKARRVSQPAAWLLSKKPSGDLELAMDEPTQPDQTRSKSASGQDTLAICKFNTGNDSKTDVTLSSRDFNDEDKHIFLVRKIECPKDLNSLMASGYRFAEPVFIAKIMGDKLRIPSDYVLSYFQDMLQMTSLASTIYKPISLSQSQPSIDKPSVKVGLFVILEEETEKDVQHHIIVDKAKRFAFPTIQLPIEKLTEEQENVIMSMQGQTLSVVASLASNMAHKDTTMNMKSTTGTTTDIQFINLFIKACKELLTLSSYGKFLAMSSKLYPNIIDIPAFVLSSSPCQLILFTAVVKGSRIGFAINQTLTEPIKCVPFNIYQSMACYMTHIAAERYRSEQSGQILQQRRIYEQPSSSSIQPHMKHIKNMTGLSTKSDNASDKAKETIPQIMASLPPPPRVKYNKNNTSVDINYMLKHPPPSSPIPPTPIELQDIITILSTKQRFAWLHDLYKELLKEDL
ncbi:hypothetical protein G6F70_001958 [Rhizopus microsporus]|uniref:MHYT domain-containing protein n=1 Tax=Rhizopus microsporus TaxID=58291 RepID=A0A1X0RTU5_RHIZD|nr:hypothetical protein G6F71_002104 [Rhizopus microsporus]KAG1202758.1 hypothetical protein G6F70_001958 [Rhizopus microsporus]KAG1214362.1 hypothetical protein G6F69_001971 [Rhizopus microsporus]KAG1236918.1 hypothetical protein G6F67_001584 [Rhizopus microsporus]KAG1267369.1 hypothetical protein G6F68_001972 [Rhizopus microsporus]